MKSDSSLSISEYVHTTPLNPSSNQPKFTFVFHEPRYKDFVQEFLTGNIPCILACDVTKKWNAQKEWVGSRGEPDLHGLCKQFGECEVPVANCAKKFYDSQPKTQQKLQEYAEYMRQHDRPGHLYLKDWHLQWEQRHRRPADRPFYRTPLLMASDWLNEFWEARPEKADDYRFVYIGVAGTWTPFHADVFRSYSWSANVCGRKRWILLPPGEEEKLRGPTGLPFDVASALGAENPDSATCSAQVRTGDGIAVEADDETGRHAVPLQPLTSPSGVQYFDVSQEAGEVIFVPSGWHHQVWNLRDTISINHNWFNASNIHLVCDHLLASLRAVREELADIADGSCEFLEQCQTLLRATHGMALAEFADLLCFTVRRRLTALTGELEVLHGLDGWPYERRHLLYDVDRARGQLRRLLALEEFQRLPELQQWRAEAQRLLDEAIVQCALPCDVEKT